MVDLQFSFTIGAWECKSAHQDDGTEPESDGDWQTDQTEITLDEDSVQKHAQGNAEHAQRQETLRLCSYNIIIMT